MASNSRIIPLQRPDLVFKRACGNVHVYAVFSSRINVKVKIKPRISNVEGNNKAHISKLFDMYGKYLRIYDKANLKTKVSSDSSRDSLTVLTKFFSFQITFSNFKESGLKSLISCLSTLRSTQCLVLAIFKCKVDSNQKGVGSRNVNLEVYKTELCSSTLFDGQPTTRRTGVCHKKEINVLKEEGIRKVGVKIVLCGDEMSHSGSRARSRAYSVKRIMSYDT